MSSIKQINEDLISKEADYEEIAKIAKRRYELRKKDGEVIEIRCPLQIGALYRLIERKGIDGWLNSSDVEIVGAEVEGEEDEKEVPDIFADMAAIEKFAEIVLSNDPKFLHLNSLVVAGPGGIGKTEKILKILEDKKIEALEVKGYSTAYCLFNTLKMNPDGVYLFDDCDSIWEDKDSLNILKAVLDTKHVRTVSWNSGEEIDSFDFRGKILFVSNRDFFGKSRAEHVGAVLTRIFFVQVTSDRKELIKYIQTEAKKIEPDVTTRETAMNYMLNNTKAAVDFRFFIKLCAVAAISSTVEDFNIYADRTAKAQRLKKSA